MIESDVQSRLKVTGWPGAVIEVPPVLAYDVVEIKAPWIEYDFMGRSTREVALPVDAYLREACDVDFNDVDALADFGAQFGILGWLHPFEGWWPSIPRQATGSSRDGGVDWLNEILHACKEQRRQQWGEPDDDGNTFVGVVHVDEVRLHLSFVRDMVSLWRCVRGDIGLADVAADWTNRVYRAPESADDAAKLLADFINPALVSQTLRVEVVDSREVDQVPSGVWGRPQVNTYQALCSQLRNDIAMNSDYYICGSKSCGRLFSRQRRDDTETIAQNRAGSRYCSITCRDRQKQLEHRRRQSAGQRAAPYKRRPPIKANGIRPD